MSYTPQSATQAPVLVRPIGVAVIAALGMFLGIAYCVYTIVLFVFRLTQGQSVVALIGTATGLLIGWAIIYLYLGLWEMARWTWVVHVVLNGGMAFGAYYVLNHITQMQEQVGYYLPDQFGTPINNWLSTGAMSSLVVSLLIVLYLIVIHRSFKIGVRDARPEWEL